MAIQTPATTKMVQNVIDGTTPVKNMMSTNTDQTITGQKVFENGKLIIKDKNGDNFTPVPYYETTETDLNNLPKVLGYFYNESGFTINTPLGARIKLVYQRMFSNGSNSWGYQECLENAIVQRRSFNVSWGEWRIMEPFSFSGNSKLPVYIRDNGQPQPIEYTLDDACAKAVSDSSSASALSSTDTNVPTVRDIYYGTPTINNSKSYSEATKIYVPLSAGTAGYLLKSGGSSGSGIPVWANVNMYPSSRASFSLPSSGGSVTPTKNGYICVSKRGTAANQYLVASQSGGAEQTAVCPSNGTECSVCMPVKANTSVKITYNAAGETVRAFWVYTN